MNNFFFPTITVTWTFAGTWRLELYFLPSPPAVSSPLPLLHLAWHLLAISVLATAATSLCARRPPPHSLKKGPSAAAAEEVGGGTERTRRRSKSSKSCTEYSLKIERRQLSGGGSSDGSTAAGDSEAASECSLVVSEPPAAGRQELDCRERISPLEEFNTLYRNRDLVRASIKLKESNLV